MFVKVYNKDVDARTITSVRVKYYLDSAPDDIVGARDQEYYVVFVYLKNGNILMDSQHFTEKEANNVRARLEREIADATRR